MFNKFHAKKTTVDGIKFDSIKEAGRYTILKALEAKGDISDLQRQVKFELIPAIRKSDGKTERKCEYVADFVYNDRNGTKIVEDVKGMKKGAAYAVFVIKRKLMLYNFGIEISEV